MQAKKFLPHWRGATEEIVLVNEPDEAWFATTCGIVRFSVLVDGSVWWGDGHTVLHADIIRARPLGLRKGAVEAIMIGVLKRDSAKCWALCFVQNWLGTVEDFALTLTFLNRLTTWRQDTAPFAIRNGVEWGRAGSDPR